MAERDGRIIGCVDGSTAVIRLRSAIPAAVAIKLSAEGPSEKAVSLLEAIAASSTDAIVGKDLNGLVTYWNDAAEQLLGFSAAEMVGQSITKLIPPARLAEETSILERVGRGERVTQFETERVSKDGTIKPVVLTISPIRNSTGTIIGISKIARDLSETNRLYRELQQREDLLQSILRTVPDGLIIIDRAGIIHSLSTPAERMFGYAAHELIGQNVKRLMPSSDAARHDGYLARYLETTERRIIGIGRVVTGQRKDGTTFPMELQVGEVISPGSHLFTGFVRDVTERLDREHRVAELQSELIHVSRVSELGQMVSALAHEVNQPLTAMANYLRGIRRITTAETDPTLRNALEKVNEQSERARGIVQSLRSLVKKEARPKQLEDLKAIIEEVGVLALIGQKKITKVDIQVAVDAEQAIVDRVQIQQVLLNIMRNAVEAMTNSEIPHLTVATMRNGEHVEVRITDTGPGIAEDVLSRLFQPFVTTKPDGLGVGLSICRTIIEGHGGKLSVDSQRDGTVFRFTLPGPDASTPPLSEI